MIFRELNVYNLLFVELADRRAHTNLFKLGVGWDT